MKYSFPADLLIHHTSVLGKTGSGKTSTSKLMIEQVVAEEYRVCILDPIKSDWWGITSSADGKKAGLPFRILGGPHGHLPLHSSAGAAIGQLVGQGKLPLSIIDMADFEPGGLQRFFSDFAPALMKHMRGVLYLVIEEAHEFAPKERAGFGAENMAIHWAKKLATAGRSKGIRLVVATQRVQSLHNALLGSCETIITHRLTTPADQEPVLKWLKANTDKETLEKVSRSLSGLPKGTGWVCSGEARIFEQVAFPKFKTYDNAATPERDGQEIHVKTAAVDQDELRKILGDAVKDAEDNDPKRLKAQIASLTKQLGIEKSQPKNNPALARDPREIEEACLAALKKGHDAAWDNAFIAIKPHLTAVKSAVDNALSQIEKIGNGKPAHPAPKINTIKPYSKPASATPSISHNAKSDSQAVVNFNRSKTLSALSATESLPQGEKAIMIVLAQYPQGCTREQLTVMTGYKRSSRDTYLQRLRGRGYIHVEGDRVIPSENGISALGSDYKPLPVGQELRDHWLHELPEGESKILQILMEAYPENVERDAISEITGYKRSSRDTYLQRLRSRQLIDGNVKASDHLFAA